MTVILATIETGINLNKGGPTGIILKILDHARKYKLDTKLDCTYDVIFSLKPYEQNMPSRIPKKIRGRAQVDLKKHVIIWLQNRRTYKYLFHLYIFINFYYRFKQRLKKSHMNDVLHFHDVMSMCIYALFIRRSYPRATVLSIHTVGAYYLEQKTSLLWKKMLRLCEKYALKNATKITFPSRGAINIYVADFTNDSVITTILGSHKVSVVYNGIDTVQINALLDQTVQKQILAQFDINIEKKKVVLTVANFISSKGVDLLPAIAQNFTNDTHFYVIGEGPLELDMRNAITERNLRNIHLVPKMDRSQLINFIRIADVFFMPSRKTVFDLVMLESMYVAGPLMIASNIPGHDEMITNGENGILCDEENYSQCISYALSINPQIKKKIMSQAKQDIIDKFTTAKMVSNFEEIY